MSVKFKSIGLWGRFDDPKVTDPARVMAEHLKARGIDVSVPAGAPALEPFGNCKEFDGDQLASTLDMIISIGGDGTLLRAARRVAHHSIPLVGVNLGRLGFLTDISPNQMLRDIDAILAGDHLSEKRKLLEGAIQVAGQESPGKPMLALNDVVLQKGASGRMLDFHTEVDDSYVNTHSGDGLIVATSTGSTAYALSCAGPIIQPTVDAIVLVPICPHTLSDRPLVVNSSCEIRITIDSGDDTPAHVTCDGEELEQMSANDTLSIRAAKETVTLLHPTDYNYYELLRSKLNWGRTSRAGHREHRG